MINTPAKVVTRHTNFSVQGDASDPPLDWSCC